MNHRYTREQAELDTGEEPFERGPAEHPIAVVIVDDLDRKTVHALQYAKTIRTSAIQALHVERDPATTDRLRARWSGRVVDVPLRVVSRNGDPTKAIAQYVDGLAGSADVSIIVPGGDRLSRWERLRRGRTGTRLARAVATNPRVRVTLVRDHPEPHAEGRGGLRLLPRANHRAVVLVDRPDRAALQAVRYALSLGAEEVVAVHAAVDPEVQDELITRWMELRIPISLDLVECWDRDVARSVERYVVDLMGPRTEVTVVIPRRDEPGLAQRLLHDRTSRSIARALGRYEHVDVAVVPFYLGALPAVRTPPGTEDDTVPEPARDLAATHRAR
jgi:hypothetical protein